MTRLAIRSSVAFRAVVSDFARSLSAFSAGGAFFWQPSEASIISPNA